MLPFPENDPFMVKGYSAGKKGLSMEASKSCNVTFNVSAGFSESMPARVIFSYRPDGVLCCSRNLLNDMFLPFRMTLSAERVQTLLSTTIGDEGMRHSITGVCEESSLEKMKEAVMSERFPGAF